MYNELTAASCGVQNAVSSFALLHIIKTVMIPTDSLI